VHFRLLGSPPGSGTSKLGLASGFRQYSYLQFVVFLQIEKSHIFIGSSSRYVFYKASPCVATKKAGENFSPAFDGNVSALCLWRWRRCKLFKIADQLGDAACRYGPYPFILHLAVLMGQDIALADNALPGDLIS